MRHRRRLAGVLVIVVLVVGLSMVLDVRSRPTPMMTPVVTAAPSPAVVLGGKTLYFPFVPQADFRWQRTGYGRTSAHLRMDGVLHGKGMWSYTWGPACNGHDIPMVFDDDLPADVFMDACAQTSTVLLLLNEPEWGTQAGLTPDQAADVIAHYAKTWPGELWCCGTLSSHAGYLDKIYRSYMGRYAGPWPIDGLHIHVYVNDGFRVADPLDEHWLARSQAGVQHYVDWLAAHKLPGKIVVSECCLLGEYPAETYVQVMDDTVRMLRSFPEALSVAWFSAFYSPYPHSNLITRHGALTEVGQAWLAQRWH
jgi:hypothetical protein